MSSFDRDLGKGKTIENIVADILRPDYPSIVVIPNKFKGYDIWIPELHKSMEVKSDLMSVETGNIVVEIEMFGKPSGLLSTTANYWVFWDGIDFIYMTPQIIIECILLNKQIYVEFVGKGDTQKKKAYLIEKDLLFSYGKNLSEFKGE